jgi:hypothetical protein
MTWRRQIDYHGSRTYGSAVATETAASRIKWIASLYLAWARQRFQTMLRSALPPIDTPSRMTGNQRGFSLLGSNARDGARPRHDDCPFPLGPARKPRSTAPRETA